jgi:hypothetical protein
MRDQVVERHRRPAPKRRSHKRRDSSMRAGQHLERELIARRPAEPVLLAHLGGERSAQDQPGRSHRRSRPAWDRQFEADAASDCASCRREEHPFT